MKIALCQIDSTVGAVEENEARVLAALDEARRLGAELCVFPELALVGYPPRDLLLEEELIRRAARAAARIARAAPDLTVVLGTAEPGVEDGPGGFPLRKNAACVLSGGSVVASRAKTLLPAYDVFHEPRWFEPAASNEPLDLLGERVGLLVCEDLWDEGYARKPARELVAAGAELLIALNASPFRHGILEQRLRRARRPGVPLVYVNAVGAEDELVFDGGSFALDARGRVVCALPRFEEAVSVFDTEAAPAACSWDEGPPETFAALTLGVRDFARKNGLRDAWIGLSGGVDSALVACVAREALGPGRVHALAIPSRFTDPRSTEDARALARALGISFEAIPLEPLHGVAEKALGSLFGVGTTGENVQARLRLLILMAHVNARGGVLLNTSNKTELALGYGTLYADLAGGLGVLADLTKTEVYELARDYEARHPGTIPTFVLERPPSAELAPDQVDPFDYPRIAPLVEALIQGVPARKLVGRGADPDEVASLEARIRAAEHKRRQAPIGLKVSARAFGTGRLVPVTRGSLRAGSVLARIEAGGKGCSFSSRSSSVSSASASGPS